MFYAHDSRKSLTYVIARQRISFEEIFLFGVGIDGACKCCTQARHVRSTVFVTDNVRIATYRFAECIRPLKCHFDLNEAFFDGFIPRDGNDVGMQYFPSFVQLANVFCKPSFIQVFGLMWFIPTLVKNCNFQTCVEESCFADSCFDFLEVELDDIGKDG